MAQPVNPTSSNGVLSAPSGRAATGANKKQKKRRAKVARQTSDQDVISPTETVGPPSALHNQPVYPPVPQNTSYVTETYDDGELPADDPDYDVFSDEDEDELLREQYMGAGNDSYADSQIDPSNRSATKKKNKKKKRRSTRGEGPFTLEQPENREAFEFMNRALLNMEHRQRQQAADAALRSRSTGKDRIWNTSTQEERERIKEFWLSLSEKDRRDLLKIEKEAVLRKMKEQQKHSCSCTVCGRKRTAIEEELEVLYDAYYEELEQYANHQHGDEILPSPHPPPPPQRTKRTLPEHLRRRYLEPSIRPLNTDQNQQYRSSRVQEVLDDDEPEFSEGEDEEFSEEDEEDEDEMYSSSEEYEDELESQPYTGGFFDFGNSLTVKGGILTVADDLLKNDGKKFIEMMEQLAERRMHREQEAEYAAREPAHLHSNGDPQMDDDEEDEYDDYSDDEEDYEEEEEDEMGGMTEEQRMEEGRRMFQIFAARMFEQRVLNAYKEKVAAERQKKLLEELAEDDKLSEQRELKKARDAEKRRNKKLAQKQAKAEDKAKKDAEKAAEEAKAREAEEKKQEQARQRKEEQRKKKEAEKKAQEDERQRKEAERIKRQQDERDRQLETERKAREQKASEKRQKEEARKKERDDRESKEKELRDKKARDDKERKEQESRNKTDKDGIQPQARGQPSIQQPPQIVKRPSQPGVAVPPGLQRQKSSSGISSPHIAVATPAIPKPATPGRPRQSSYQESHASSPLVPSLSNGPSKSTSPSSTEHAQNLIPKTILQNPSKQQQTPVTLPQPSSVPQPPPGVHPPYNTGFGNMGFPPYQGQFGPSTSQRPSISGFPQPSPIGGQYRSFPPNNAPPGIAGLGTPQGRGFTNGSPPGFAQQLAPIGAPGSGPGFSGPRVTMPTHSRQPSLSERIDLDIHGHGPTQPISRPAPIQRPSSVKPSEGVFGKKSSSKDVDDLNKHLGSSALLDDVEDEIPSAVDSRRTSNPLGPQRGIAIGSPMFGGTPGRVDAFGGTSGSWSSPNPFGTPSLGTSGWGSSLNNSAWPGTTFGSLGAQPRPSASNRPLAIRLAICQACRQLSTPSGDNFHDVSQLLQSIDRHGGIPEHPPSLKEIEDICETEGDSQNGGGTLLLRRSGPNFAVKYEPDDGAPSAIRPPNSALGEIGSPIPTNAAPAFGSGRGFGSIAGLSSPGTF